MADFKDNPSYRPVYATSDGIVFYEPAADTNYHNSRLVAAGALNIYAGAGITPQLLEKVLDEMEKAVNTNKVVDVAVWINNLRYRKRYPVDEDVALRMAAVFTFLQGEDPNRTENHWTERKVAVMKADPEAYSFFLPMGIANTAAYRNLAETISQSYFQQRAIELERLVPEK